MYKINQSYHPEILNALNRVKNNYIPNNTWLGSNKYNHSKDICSIKKNTQFSLKDKNCLSEYIAVSSILHCFDGWNYLSSSIECLISGDSNNSVHLAYYAELRAIISILASQGIGIFQNNHVYFDNQNNIKLFSSGTHKAAKEQLLAWANESTNNNILFDVIKINDININEWINNSPYTIPGFEQKTISNWLKIWSIDINNINDNELRNNASYRPHLSNKKIRISENIKNIAHLWNASSPYLENGFYLLDLTLLRLVLKHMFDDLKKGYKALPASKENNSITIDNMNFPDFIEKICNNSEKDIPSQTKKMLKSDQTSNMESTNWILNTASINDSTTSNNPFPIICRAFLLLRLSIASSKNLIIQTSLSRDPLKFWWENIGLNMGLWDSENEPESFSDLYEDVFESLNSIQDCNIPSDQTLFKTSATNPYELSILKQFQRAALWGLGL